MLVTKGLGNAQLMVTRGMSYYLPTPFKEIINLTSRITIEFSKKSIFSIKHSFNSKIVTVRNLISIVFE